MNGQAKNQTRSRCVQNVKPHIGTLRENTKKSQGRLIDETGNVYGMLTVLEYAGSLKELKGSDGGAAWLCRCECGAEVIAKGAKLRAKLTTRCGNHTKKPKGVGSFNAIYRVMSWRAKSKNIKWELTKDFLKEITKLPCNYCGMEPSNIGSGSANGNYIYSGVDRVDSSLGYTVDNVVPCCSTCNKAKMQMSVVEFFEWIQRVVAHNWTLTT